MKDYQKLIKTHLARYASGRLGVYEYGIYKCRHYAHILPYRNRFLNILEPIRAEFQSYWKIHQEIKLHKCFHHLNSSQALAFNLFYPFLSADDDAVKSLTAALGLTWRGFSHKYLFEYVPDKKEGTNIDVAWCDGSSNWTYCEVKLTENAFGVATDDNRHRVKLEEIYRPQLTGLVDDALLHRKEFNQHYQILRMVALLARAENSQVAFILPRANSPLFKKIEAFLPSLKLSIANRVHVSYLEDALAFLSNHAGNMTNIGHLLMEKYIPI